MSNVFYWATIYRRLVLYADASTIYILLTSSVSTHIVIQVVLEYCVNGRLKNRLRGNCRACNYYKILFICIRFEVAAVFMPNNLPKSLFLFVYYYYYYYYFYANFLRWLYFIVGIVNSTICNKIHKDTILVWLCNTTKLSNRSNF